MNAPRSLRSLASRPTLPAAAIVTLALGLGVNAAIFSLTREVLLRPLPYRDADRLVRVAESSESLGRKGAAVAPVNYAAWRDGADTFELTAAFRRVQFNVAIETTAVQVEGFLVAPEFFPMLGVEPAAGRQFTAADARPGADSVLILTDGFKNRLFGSTGALGRTIDVDGTPCVVVGVLPPTFQIYRVLNRELELFRPLVLDRTDHEQSLNIYAKLKTGVSLAAAQSQLATLYAHLPPPGQLWSGEVTLLSSAFAANARPILLILEWAAAFVLLIASANVATLLLAHSTWRRREFAVRHALGASRWRIARDLAGESLLLTGVGGVLALFFSGWIVAILNHVVSFQDVNRLQPFRLDGLVIAFVVLVTFVLTLAFAMVPAAIAHDVDVVTTLKESGQSVTSGTSHQRLRQVLIVTELALSIVLATSALALTRSALALRSLARGLRVDRVATAQISLSGARYADTNRLEHSALLILDRLRATPGVESASIVNYLPLALIRVGVPVSIEGSGPGRAGERPVARYWVASPRYFETVGIPILAGRDFTGNDDMLHAGAAIVSETFARRFWNTTDVVGRRIRPEFPQSDAFWIPRGSREWRTIVGVVANVREDGIPDIAGAPQMYLPFAQNPTVVVTLLARDRPGEQEIAAGAIREAVRSVDPQAPVSYEMAMSDAVQESFARSREMAWIVGAFSILALVLSATGVYGLMAFLTATRTREIEVRVVLGAAPIDVISLIVTYAFKLTAAGVVIGAALAPLALRVAGSLLFGVSPFDPSTLVAVTALLGGVAMTAAAIPAVRAARTTSFRLR